MLIYNHNQGLRPNSNGQSNQIMKNKPYKTLSDNGDCVNYPRLWVVIDKQQNEGIYCSISYGACRKILRNVPLSIINQFAIVRYDAQKIGGAL